VGAFLIRIPVSFIMSKIEPVSLFKVGLATPASTFIQIILCIGFFIFLSKKSLRNLSINY
ncbi:MAG: MATE family efflux transporter, partial [Clostridium sp.]